MKLKDYMGYLKILHDRYGDDIEVKVRTTITLESIEFDDDIKQEDNYTDALRPRYNKENNCIVIHKDFVTYTF